jgi:hypothetical protein
MLRMPGIAVDAIDLTSLPAEVAALIERLQHQAKLDSQELARRDRDIVLARVKIDKLNFELARLKRWKFDAKTETMTAAQRLLFADTLAEDEASLQAKLAELQRGLPETPKTPKAPPRRPRRRALPEHLERVEHRHEPEDTTCPNADCGRPMQRIGEDVSEKLDIVPAKFFGLAGRAKPEAWPFARHKQSAGLFVSGLSTGTSTASGPASAASNCARSRPSRTSSTAASRLPDWWRTP